MTGTAFLRAAEKPLVLDLGARITPHRHQARVLRTVARELPATITPPGQRIARFVNVGAGVGAGKTWVTTRLALKRVCEDFAFYYSRGDRWHPTRGVDAGKVRPFLHYWFVGPVYSQTKLLEREVSDALAEFPDVIAYWKGQSLWLAGGILIEFKSGSNPKNLAGPTLDGILITEAARLNPVTWSDVLRGRLRGRAPKPGEDTGRAPGWCVTDTTPLGHNWYWEEFWRRGLEGKYHDPSFVNFSWTTSQNAASPETQADVENARRQLPPRLFRRDYEASWECFEGQVYDEWSPAVHVVPASAAPRTFDTVLAGQDWGWRNPAGFLVGGLRDGTLWIVEEQYAAGLQVRPKSDSEDCWVNRALEAQGRYGIEAWVCDPSAPEDIEAFVEAGLPAEGAENDIFAGVREVSKRLHYERGPAGDFARAPELFVVGERCPNLVREVAGLHYPEKAHGPGSEYPVKKDDHSTDMLRYLVMKAAELSETTEDVGIEVPARPSAIQARALAEAAAVVPDDDLGGLAAARGDEVEPSGADVAEDQEHPERPQVGRRMRSLFGR